MSRVSGRTPLPRSIAKRSPRVLHNDVKKAPAKMPQTIQAIQPLSAAEL
jgi:hypothetical protein